jgi:hypothetical protein
MVTGYSLNDGGGATGNGLRCAQVVSISKSIAFLKFATPQTTWEFFSLIAGIGDGFMSVAVKHNTFFIFFGVASWHIDIIDATIADVMAADPDDFNFFIGS